MIKSEIHIGVSSCLLGNEVRYDSSHKKDDFLINMLGKFVTYVQVCPEVEVGMGVPRESVRLIGDIDNPSMIGTKTGIDWTDRMNKYSSARVKKNDIGALSGFILKKRSPSCGMERVKIYNEKGAPAFNGIGLFARALIEKHPYLPVEEEGRLVDAKIRENFIIRVFSYKRLQNLYADKFSKNSFIRFHTIHKYLMLSHSPKHYKELGKMIASVSTYKADNLKSEFRTLFMEGLKLKSTVKKNTNVLQHIIGFMKKQLTSQEKKMILEAIEDYHNNLVPLIVPITLLRHYINKYNIEYIKDQIYLNPHPKELMLLNHV